MKRMQMSIMSLMALVLLVGFGIVQGAEAAIRFNATLHTPNVRVFIGNTPYGHYQGYMKGHIPIRVPRHYKVTERDRAIASRLARYTGVPARELIQLRSRGYHWFEIGRWLHLPRPVVRAAMHHRSWVRFLREERLAGRGVHPRKRRLIAYSE
jgi:hypothetical protein